MKKLYFVRTNAYNMIVSDDGEIRRVLVENNDESLSAVEDPESYLQQVEDDSSWEGTSKTSSLELPIDNFLGMEYVLPEYVSSNDEFIVVVAPEQANELASKVDMPHVSEDSNPVLYILHAKK